MATLAISVRGAAGVAVGCLQVNPGLAVSCYLTGKFRIEIHLLHMHLCCALNMAVQCSD